MRSLPEEQLGDETARMTSVSPSGIKCTGDAEKQQLVRRGLYTNAVSEVFQAFQRRGNTLLSV